MPKISDSGPGNAWFRPKEEGTLPGELAGDALNASRRAVEADGKGVSITKDLMDELVRQQAFYTKLLTKLTGG